VINRQATAIFFLGYTVGALVVMKRRFASVALCLACVGAHATRVYAQTTPATAAAATTTTAAAPTSPASPTTYSLELTPNDCAVDDAQLAQAIQARVPAAQRLPQGGDVAIRAELWNHGVSSLTVTLPQGASRREFPGASCEEANAIVAFISALVLDAPPEDRLKATELASLPEERSDKRAEPEPKPVVAPPAEQPATPARDRTPARPSALRFGVDAALALETAVAPSPPFGGLFGVNVSWPIDGWLSPELRGGLLVTGRSSQAADAGAVDFNLIAGHVSACPLRGSLLRQHLVLGLCATFDYGYLHGQGNSNVLDGKLSSMPWVAGGLSLLAEVPLSQAFRLELEGGGRRLAYHDRFTLDPDPSVMTSTPAQPLQVYDVPAFSAGFAVGLGFQL
jgi:hypothetical protein